MDNAVALVQAYLRLNGFFTVTEFQVQQSAAVRRAGCCPEGHFKMVVTQLATHGEAKVASAEGIPCRLRLASFCGVAGSEATEPVLLTITLGHIIAFVQDRLRTYAPILRSVAFRDPVLDLMKLMWKLGITRSSTRVRWRKRH